MKRASENGVNDALHTAGNGKTAKTEAAGACHAIPAFRSSATEIQRFRKLVEEGVLLHPIDASARKANFADLAHGLALACGNTPSRTSSRLQKAQAFARDIGGAEQEKKHIVFMLCDGMGNDIIRRHLKPESFLRRHNDENRLLAVFPCTTPAALTTLATGAWPGQHGMPGWDLRDQKGCDFPGQPAVGPVQLKVLNAFAQDGRSSKPLKELGFTDEEVYVTPAWTSLKATVRHMRFVNAYNGTDFTNWYQGLNNANIELIPETAVATLGEPEGSETAVKAFREGVDCIIKSVKEGESNGWSTYTYMYTAHPDKHMHALGVDHIEVKKIMDGFDAEFARLWENLQSFDVSLLVTADHGHVSVEPTDMVLLPDSVVKCLEYACVGVHGKGRHAYLHCRSGRLKELEAKWFRHPELCDNFLLLAVDDAAAEGLFGPEEMLPEVRPRLGDYVAVPTGSHTIVSPDEAVKYRDAFNCKCRGAHGAPTPAEMEIPFVLLQSKPNKS
eukprot:TRINITY_DN25632_c0_g1_i1.p1 TRINITY_DN25632_c0_g1~~TRINITY_DN25632_c0_g1_i1.p1  ORF type:complete len:501 (+),score=70.66 TRINITY_DN25632_c0_g1_i1:301-1803(+)